MKFTVQNTFVVSLAVYFCLGYAIGQYNTKETNEEKPAPEQAVLAESKVTPAFETPASNADSNPSKTNTATATATPAGAAAPQPKAVPTPARKPTAAPAPKTAQGAAKKPNLDQIWNVTVDAKDASLGPSDALVTCVLFTAFGCPTCQAMSTTPTKLQKKFGKNVRTVFKHKVIPPSDPESLEASIASLAAKQQGKFWPYHDRLFKPGAMFNESSLVQYARELKLKEGKFKRDLKNPALRAQALKDALLANSVGAHSMPNLLCNGVRMRGDKSYENAEKLVAQELAKAKQKVASGAKAKGLYSSLISGGKSFPQLSPNRVRFNTSQSPALGPANAKVEVVAFEDFECPYCARVGTPLKSFQAMFPKNVRFVFKHLPLTSIHPNAQMAAEASFEAKAQGKFWEFHDLLFANQKALGRVELESYAERVGMDVNKLKQALDSGKYKGAVQRDVTEARRAGVSSTPVVFVNGRKYQGPRGYPPQGLEAISRAYLGL